MSAGKPSLEQLSHAARHAVQRRDWAQVGACAAEILRREPSAEGFFLAGLAEQAANRLPGAIEAFHRALALDSQRYDAAVELASTDLRLQRHGDAVRLLDEYAPRLANSPRYLRLAADIYSKVGLPERALPLLRQALQLQPDIDALRTELAGCCVQVGLLDEAREAYRGLLQRHPAQQRIHFELSRIVNATDDTHVEAMRDVIRRGRLTPERSIYLHYALGKELEDLERWDEAFEHYRQGGEAAAAMGNYDVAADVDIINAVIEACDKEWLSADSQAPLRDKTPIFVVGLPRSGTTLVDRILSSHSQIESAGESFFLQTALRRASGDEAVGAMRPDIVARAAEGDCQRIAEEYLGAIAYRLGDAPYFVEKLPENFNYLGFIAKAFPGARIVHVHRHPMDACFAMFKQSYFRFAYRLEDLATYYLAHDRLRGHWRDTLGDRLIEVSYESLVAEQESQTRTLLERVGVDFEPACLEFEKNKAASTTASAAQIREKMHARSVGRWRRFKAQLEPLAARIAEAGLGIG